LGKGLGVLSFSVNLGDRNVRLVDEVVGESFPDGCEGLAVCINVSCVLLSLEQR
jgi:hypothetical protein